MYLCITRPVLGIFLISKRHYLFRISIVHNFLLFPNQAKSLILTDWLACFSAIGGQNIKASSLSANSQAIFFNRLFKGIPQRRIEFFTRLTG